MRSTTRTLCVALALTLSASPAAAQFTAVVAPPKAKTQAAQAAGEATPGASTNAQGNTSLADMRAWVDSAAGVTAPADSARDTTSVEAAAGVEAQQPATPTPSASAVDEPGAMRAPDTATMVPAAAVIGLAMLGAGAWLLRRARA